MQTLLYAGTSEYLEIPKSENAQVQTISREVNKTDLAWLAGILDGEGSLQCGISIWKYKNKERPNIETIERLWYRISIQNTDVRMIKKISQIYKYLNIRFHYEITNQTNRNKDSNYHRHNTIGIIITSTRGIIKILSNVLPYLVNKKDQANYLFDIVNYRLKLGFCGNKKILNDSHLRNMLQRYREIKHRYYLIDPSTTTRRASQELSW